MKNLAGAELVVVLASNLVQLLSVRFFCGGNCMFAHVAKDVFRLFTLVCVASIPCVVSAQVVPAVKQAPKGDIAAKWDFFAGYSYIRPY